MEKITELIKLMLMVAGDFYFFNQHPVLVFLRYVIAFLLAISITLKILTFLGQLLVKQNNSNKSDDTV